MPDPEEGLRFFSDWLGFAVKFTVDFHGQRIVILNADGIELERRSTARSEIRAVGYATITESANGRVEETNLEFSVAHRSSIVHANRVSEGDPSCEFAIRPTDADNDG